jgi:UDP-N-acetylglucosamine--N-acetylmuramyl-(pentapeptide) pyrophosphoryl-undecaprenol N-acetylglucosamine transferase
MAGWDRTHLLEMAHAARAVAIPDATERVAAEVVAASKK